MSIEEKTIIIPLITPNKDLNWFNLNSDLILKKDQIVFLKDSNRKGQYKIGNNITKLKDLEWLPKIPTTNIVTPPSSFSENKLITKIVAQEFLPAYSLVNSDGTVANSNNIYKRNKAFGIVTQDINNGFSGDVVIDGEITYSGWNWNLGDILYLNSTVLSNIAPISGFNQRIALAKDPITIKLQIGKSILI